MARLFNDASSEYMTASNVVSGTPCTFACWARTNVLGLETRMITINDSNSSSNVLSLLLDQSTNKIQAQHYVAGGNGAFSSTTMSTNTWHHCAAVFISDASRTAYLDGGGAVNDTESKSAMSGLDVTDIGALYWSGGRIQFWSGDLCEAAIWNVALTAKEVAILAAGFSPLFVRPQNLVGYWPLVRDLNDRVGDYKMTATGTVVSAHPRIIYPSAVPMVSFAVAAPTGRIMSSLAHRGGLVGAGGIAGQGGGLAA